MNKSIDDTLKAYANKHKNETGHRTIVYGNYCECSVCQDHAHYVAHMEMIKHNADYSVNERIKLFE